MTLAELLVGMLTLSFVVIALLSLLDSAVQDGAARGGAGERDPGGAERPARHDA